MSFLKNINKKFLIFKKICILGLFRTKKVSYLGENSFYNSQISYLENNMCSIGLTSVFKSINKLYPLISLLILKNNSFLFISVDKFDSSFLTKIFYTLLKKIKSYCIYDWGFGLLTNFSKTYFEFFIDQKVNLHKMPDIAFFLRILEKQHYIMTEIQHSSTLSLGLVDYENAGCVDYPVLSNTSLEYSYFFLRILSKFFLNSNKNKIYNDKSLYLSSLKINKIKRLKFCNKILLQNRKKKSF